VTFSIKETIARAVESSASLENGVVLMCTC
jgi:hypothetical protein